MYNQFFQNPEPEPKQEKVLEVNGYSGALANGGDSKAACFKLLKEKGINPDDVAKMIGK